MRVTSGAAVCAVQVSIESHDAGAGLVAGGGAVDEVVERDQVIGAALLPAGAAVVLFAARVAGELGAVGGQVAERLVAVAGLDFAGDVDELPRRGRGGDARE